MFRNPVYPSRPMGELVIVAETPTVDPNGPQVYTGLDRRVLLSYSPDQQAWALPVTTAHAFNRGEADISRTLSNLFGGYAIANAPTEQLYARNPAPGATDAAIQPIRGDWLALPFRPDTLAAAPEAHHWFPFSKLGQISLAPGQHVGLDALTKRAAEYDEQSQAAETLTDVARVISTSEQALPAQAPGAANRRRIWAEAHQAAADAWLAVAQLTPNQSSKAQALTNAADQLAQRHAVDQGAPPSDITGHFFTAYDQQTSLRGILHQTDGRNADAALMRLHLEQGRTALLMGQRLLPHAIADRDQRRDPSLPRQAPIRHRVIDNLNESFHILTNEDLARSTPQQQGYSLQLSVALLGELRKYQELFGA